jgi:hypothetical protein
LPRIGKIKNALIIVNKKTLYVQAVELAMLYILHIKSSFKLGLPSSRPPLVSDSETCTNNLGLTPLEVTFKTSHESLESEAILNLNFSMNN